MSKMHEHRFLPCMGQSLNCGTFFYVHLKKNCSTVDLQCCVSFKCTAK